MVCEEKKKNQHRHNHLFYLWNWQLERATLTADSTTVSQIFSYNLITLKYLCSPGNYCILTLCLSGIRGHMKGKLVHKFNIVSAWHPVVPRGSNLSFCLIALIMYEWKKGHTHLWQTHSPAGLWVTLGQSRRQQSSPAPRHPWESRRTTTSRRCSRVWSHAELDRRGHISVRKRWGKSPRHQSDKGEAKKKKWRAAKSHLKHATHRELQSQVQNTSTITWDLK